MSKSQNLYNKAKRIIPGGTQLLSKRPEMFAPGQWPTYYQKAHGCEVTDLDGKKYKDFSVMGVGTNILGYGNDQVDNAVKKVQLREVFGLAVTLDLLKIPSLISKI